MLWPLFKVTITSIILIIILIKTTIIVIKIIIVIIIIIIIIIIIFCTFRIYDLHTGLKKTSAIMKISDLQESFIKRIERMVSGFDEGRVVFDRYLDSSLKNKTCQKRSTTSVEFKIHPEMRLTMSIKDLLSSSKSKSMLVTLFANGLLARFFSNTAIKLVVVCDNKIRYLDCEEEHTHEEVDTLIPNQVLRSIDEHLVQEICVSSPDTDVLVLWLDFISRGRHGNLNGLKFLTGKGTNYREIDVIQRVQAIGIRKCQGLIGLHHFTGADWGGKFVGMTTIPQSTALESLVKVLSKTS